MNKRLIKLIISAVVFIALAIVCFLRWNAWFGNPDETPYTLSAEPQRVMLTIGEEGGNSRYVSWFSMSKDSGVVELLSDSDTIAIGATRAVRHTRAGITQIFSAKLRNLASGKCYHYRVRNGLLQSPWFGLQMPQAHQQGFSFLNIGDIQDQDEKTAVETKRLYAEIISRHPECELVLQNGDFIERPMDKYWELQIASLDTFATMIPFVVTAGNHEYLKGVCRKLDNRYKDVFPYFNANQEVEGAVASFAYGDCRFIILDSNSEFWDMPRQSSWLKEELSKSKEKWKIVMLHHPLYSVRGKTRNFFPKLAFRSAIEDGGVDVVLQGHEHAYGRKFLLNEEKPHTPLYIVSYFSAKAYPLKFEGDFQRYGSYYRYYQLFNIKNDTLEMKTYNEKHELYDHVVIVKQEGKTSISDLADHSKVNVDMADWYRKEKGDKKADKAEKTIREWKEKHGIK